jgi:hypothetical protein
MELTEEESNNLALLQTLIDESYAEKIRLEDEKNSCLAVLKELGKSLAFTNEKLKNCKDESVLHMREDIKYRIEENNKLLEELKTSYADILIFINTLNLRKKELQKDDIRVTDHAIVRYLERSLKIDIQGIRDELLPKDVIMDIIKNEGECKITIPIKEKMITLVCTNYKVVTLYEGN